MDYQISERHRIPLVTVIAINLVPIIAIIFQKWDLIRIMVFYLLEGFVVMAFHVIRVLISTVYEAGKRPREERLYLFISSLMRDGMKILIFLLFFSFQVLITIMMVIFSIDRADSLLPFIRGEVNGIIFSLAILLAAYSLSFLRFIAKREYRSHDHEPPYKTTGLAIASFLGAMVLFGILPITDSLGIRLPDDAIIFIPLVTIMVIKILFDIFFVFGWRE